MAYISLMRRHPYTPFELHEHMYMSCPHTFRENKFSRTFEFEMIVEYEHEQFELDFEVKK